MKQETKELIEDGFEIFKLQQTCTAKEKLLYGTIEQIESSRKKIIELEKLRDDLTHMIVHDLKNPLVGIVSTIEMFLTDMLGPITEEQKKFLKTAQVSSKKLSNMISDLLDIRKAEDNKLKPSKSRFPVADLTKNLSWMESYAKRDEKKLEVKTQKGLVINADLNLLTRILENLLSNAIKHTGRKGMISLKISKDKDQILFEVQDNGEGIPEQYLGRVFDRFFKVEDQKMRTKLDTGLGLTFCKMAVEAHGGRIGAESKVGQGSRFFFRLP